MLRCRLVRLLCSTCFVSPHRCWCPLPLLVSRSSSSRMANGRPDGVAARRFRQELQPRGSLAFPAQECESQASTVVCELALIRRMRSDTSASDSVVTLPMYASARAVQHCPVRRSIGSAAASPSGTWSCLWRGRKRSHCDAPWSAAAKGVDSSFRAGGHGAAPWERAWCAAAAACPRRGCRPGPRVGHGSHPHCRSGSPRRRQRRPGHRRVADGFRRCGGCAQQRVRWFMPLTSIACHPSGRRRASCARAEFRA